MTRNPIMLMKSIDQGFQPDALMLIAVAFHLQGSHCENEHLENARMLGAHSQTFLPTTAPLALWLP